MKTTIPFNNLKINDQQVQAEIEQAVLKVVRSGSYILGEELSLFEEVFADYLGVKYCVGVGNGLDALKISLRVLGVGCGDEVIVPANTYIATVLAVSEVGAVPVLVEPSLKDGLIDVSKIEAKISHKTKAIIPVHLYGTPCDMDPIVALSKKHNVYIVEDNAQAVGAVYKGEKTGSIGHVNAQSFYPTKNLGALGDGGAITTNDPDLARKARLYRNYGSEMKYHNEVLGYNSRLDDIQAAVLRVKLSYLDEWNQQRRILQKQYYEGLSMVKHITLFDQKDINEIQDAPHLLVARVKNREALITYLSDKGIATGIHYPVSPYEQRGYSGFFKDEIYPCADILSKEVVSLPLFIGLTTDQVNHVIATVKSAYHIL